MELRFRGASLLAALALLGGAGCGDIDGGSGGFPGTVVYESPAKDFHFHLLEPPWIPVKLPTGEIFFLVPPSGTISITAAQETDAAFTLHVALQYADAATALQSNVTGQQDLKNRRALTTAGGDTGFEIAWQEAPLIYHRDAYVNGSSAGSSYQLRFIAKTAIPDDQMIGQMIDSFEPRSFSASRVGH